MKLHKMLVEIAINRPVLTMVATVILFVALGALIVVTVVYFQDGIMGYLRHTKPEWFGVRVERKELEPAE